MKKLMLLSLLSTFIFYSCSDDDSCTTCKEDNGSLVTPDLSVTLSDTQSPMTGVLEAYPCQAGGAIYYGNYIEGKLTPFRECITSRTERSMEIRTGKYLSWWALTT